MSYATVLRFTILGVLSSMGHPVIGMTVWFIGYFLQKALYNHLMSKI
jgi:hypothetical protein